MAITTKTLQAIVDRAVVYFRTSFPGYPLGTKTFFGRVSRAVALNIWGLQKSIEDVDLDIVPSPQNSTDALSEWAALLGLPDGGGGFGRLLPTVSSGGGALLTGVLGTVYPNNATATAEDGSTIVKLSGSVTIPGSGTGFGSIAGLFVSVTPGSVANLPIGTVCTWDSPPAGADPSFTLTAAFAGGIDTESNADCYARIVTRLQTPPRGGSAEDYVLWAQSVAGIKNVYIYPRREGTGTLDLIPTTAGSGQARIPSDDQILAVEAVVLANRPVAVDGVYTQPPYMPDATGHLIKVVVTPSRARYDFDWNDTADVYQVDDTGATGYIDGPPPQIRLHAQLAPASLKTAIDAYVADPINNLAPRLQVISTGSVVNPPIRAVAWSDGGGETTLTLEALPDGWTRPVAFDRIYAYGPAVETIAAGLLALIDSLGPSLQSGRGDPLNPWFDTLTISGITAVAENAIDTDGTPFIQKVPVGDATIDGVATDLQPNDSETNPPEILYASAIVVSQ